MVDKTQPFAVGLNPDWVWILIPQYNVTLRNSFNFYEPQFLFL